MSSFKKNHDFLQRITSGLFGIANSIFSGNTDDITTIPVPTSTSTPTLTTPSTPSIVETFEEDEDEDNDEDITVGAGVFPSVVVDPFPDPDTTSTPIPTPMPTPTTINEDDDGFNLEEYHAEQQRKKVKEGSRYNAYDDDASTNNQEVKNIMCSFLPNDCPLINALTYCANCNKKAEPFTLKMCTACRSVCYCNDDCQKAHRKYHKHQCKQDALEIQVTAVFLAKHHDIKQNSDDTDVDDELFLPIPPQDDCPICILPLPINYSEKSSSYTTCCGNRICVACSEEDIRVTFERGQIPRCPFCREPTPTSDDEIVVRIKKRIEMDDSEAIFHLSQVYEFGRYGLSKDPQTAFDLLLRAAELGNSDACCNVAIFYKDGVAVPTDLVKSMEYRKEAAKKGNIYARHNLGTVEWKDDNHRVASQHWLISAAAGDTDSLVKIAKSYRREFVTKNEYATALASYSNVHKDEWSIEREAAAAAVADETRQRNSSSN